MLLNRAFLRHGGAILRRDWLHPVVDSVHLDAGVAFRRSLRQTVRQSASYSKTADRVNTAPRITNPMLTLTSYPLLCGPTTVATSQR